MSYEFALEEEKVFNNFAIKLMLIGLGVIIWSIIEGLIVIEEEQSIIYFLILLLQAVIGIFLLYPSRHFMKIKTTTGRDIKELMSGIYKLRITLTIFLGLNILILILQLLQGGLIR